MSLAEVCELVSPFGDLHQVLPSELVVFCTQHGLVKLCDQTGLPKAQHIDELRRLLDPISRLRQLNGWQPLHKLRFLQKIDVHNMKPIAERSIEPVLGDEKHFVLHVCSNKEDMKNVFNYEELAKYLKSKGMCRSRTPTSTHYRGWRQVNLSTSSARRLLLQMSASRQPESVLASISGPELNSKDDQAHIQSLQLNRQLLLQARAPPHGFYYQPPDMRAWLDSLYTTVYAAELTEGGTIFTASARWTGTNPCSDVRIRRPADFVERCAIATSRRCDTSAVRSRRAAPALCSWDHIDKFVSSFADEL